MAIAHARELRKHMTDAERCLWRELKQRQIGGVKFRRQQPIGPFIADFVCFERRIVVEIDGGQHAERVAYDVARTRWLERQGYCVLRYWNNDVLTKTHAVADQILDCVEGRPPT
jgi:very-short-patch-repair endonuclease